MTKYQKKEKSKNYTLPEDTIKIVEDLVSVFTNVSSKASEVIKNAYNNSPSKKIFDSILNTVLDADKTTVSKQNRDNSTNGSTVNDKYLRSPDSFDAKDDAHKFEVPSYDTIDNKATAPEAENDETPPITASSIRERVKNALYQRADTESPYALELFDDIDDETIERNAPIAKETVKNNISRGILPEDAEDKYPYLLDGLTLFYAASEKSDKKAAKFAYDAAYAPSKNETSSELAKTNSTGSIVTKDNSTDPISFHKEDSNYQTHKNTEYKPIPRKTYSIINRSPKKIGAERILEIAEEKQVTREHAKIIFYSEKWKNIPEYKWTATDILYWKTFGGDKFLHSEKISYIKNYKNVVLDAAKKYNLPPLLLAGVMYKEYGGDPMFIDDVAYGVRSFDWSGPDWVDKNLTVTKNPDLTSFGNTSIQVRRAIEMLGYTNDTDKRNKIITSLKDPIQNIYMTACHLNVLRNIDFAGKSANDLTEDEIKITASRYNIGPDPAINAIGTDYGQVIYDNKDEILKALGL